MDKEVKKEIKKYAQELSNLKQQKAKIDAKEREIKEKVYNLYQRAGINKMTTDYGTISITATYRWQVNIDELPKKYVKIEKKADTTKLRQAVEDGVAIKGVEYRLTEDIRFYP